MKTKGFRDTAAHQACAHHCALMRWRESALCIIQRDIVSSLTMDGCGARVGLSRFGRSFLWGYQVTSVRATSAGFMAIHFLVRVYALRVLFDLSDYAF